MSSSFFLCLLQFFFEEHFWDNSWILYLYRKTIYKNKTKHWSIFTSKSVNSTLVGIINKHKNKNINHKICSGCICVATITVVETF